MPTAERYVCIHGHFYQPPRENPWLETVETQDSAAPYHDWNERITAECYAPNGASRILNARNEIIRILNNYSRISFNFGPTLLSWLGENAPRTMRMIAAADKRSQERFSGHGSALAQVYNHIIMPLANTRDRVTQIRWGIADFEHRFGRKPEGMWLAETAVDNETLDLLAAHGILFTILAPHQCARVRPMPSTAAQRRKKSLSPEQETAPNPPAWRETPHASVDTTQPYLVRLKSGRSIAVFFYDGPRSRAIAFEGLLNSGETFANRLVSGFDDKQARAQLVHVATDGESYGHHHKHGDMALAYALKYMEQHKLAHVTNYGEFLEKFPPTSEAEIYENTSWSCAHGVERWRSNCGCNGGHPGWNQEWRAPLRAALDDLRDAIAPLYQDRAEALFHDPWAARDAYIDVVLDRSHDSVERFLGAHATHPFSAEERITALELMELQRHAMLMYTSCGWFFDDISGIETVQIIAYAGRVLQLAADLFPNEHKLIESNFVERLRLARSNRAEDGNGAQIYERQVQPLEVNLEQVAAHYAISSVFSSYADETRLFCYSVRRLAYDVFTSGRGRVVVGQAEVSSTITGEHDTMAFAVLHFGDQNITAAVKRFSIDEIDAYVGFLTSIGASVTRADFPDTVRLIDRYFGASAYSIKSLFTDEQRRILRMILNTTLLEVETSLITIYEDHASLLHFLSQSGLPKPPALTLAAGFAVNAGLRRALETDPIDAIRVRALLGLAHADQISLDTRLLGYIADQRMKRVMVSIYDQPFTLEPMESALLMARTLRELPFELNLWQAQNIWYDTLKIVLPLMDDHPDEEQHRWTERFQELGRHLYICVDQLVVEEEPGNGIHASIGK
jgi:alpha-amylase/alpha-mannosidase (GH57 family)